MRNTYTPDDVKEGSVITVRGGFGRDCARNAVVTDIDREGKNGFATLSYYPVGGSEDRQSWAYFDQVDRVIRL